MPDKGANVMGVHEREASDSPRQSSSRAVLRSASPLAQNGAGTAFLEFRELKVWDAHRQWRNT